MSQARPHSVGEQAHPDNAMTEIALALAMAFFSIMVLAMVSMGAGQFVDVKQTPDVDIPNMAVAEPAGEGQAATAEPVEPPDLLVHYQGRFFDADLKPVNPTAFQPNGTAVLALDPGLSIDQALKARAQVAHVDITVTTLDARWLARLKEMNR